MKKVINCTPHAVNIINGDINIEIAPSGIIPRVSSTLHDAGLLDTNIGAIPLSKNVYGDLVGLPSEDPDTILIVSLAVAKAAPDRTDLAIPNDTVRDDRGNIIGAKSLCLININ